MNASYIARRWHAGVLLLCGCAQSIPPGAGEISKDAATRLKEEETAATVANAIAAIGAADAAPGDLRATRKASELTVAALAHGGSEDKARVRSAASGVLERLVASADPCVDAAFAARVETAADKPGPAADLYVRAADACGTPESTITAARALRAAKRCPEAVRVVERGWSRAPTDAWVGLMDAVAACSTAVSLRKNLAFVPEAAREDYFALLAARHREEERRREREERDRREQAAEERRQSEAFASRSRCASHCGNAESSCISSCAGSGPCVSRCSALRSACLAGCQ